MRSTFSEEDAEEIRFSDSKKVRKKNEELFKLAENQLLTIWQIRRSHPSFDIQKFHSNVAAQK